jgi:uncharacterized membrane protein
MEFLANMHSRIVHFPIAFLMLYPFMELIFLFSRKDYFSKSAMLFLAIGVIGSFFAVLSGNQTFELINNWTTLKKEIFHTHQTFANLTVWYFSILLVLRYFLFIKKKLNTTTISIIFVLSLIGGYFVFQAGYYGGKLADQIIISSASSVEAKK